MNAPERQDTTSAATPARPRWLKVLIAVAGMCLAVVAVDLVLRAGRSPGPASPPAPVIRACGDCPQIYELNPRHTGVSPQGFRDHLFSSSPADGTFRIAVLGDSSTYGMAVSPAEAFPKILEKTLATDGARVEVLNAGAPAYTPYNEWKLYVSKVRNYRPNLVLVSFSMDDVVDPALHWLYLASPAIARKVPDAAVPNPAHHRDDAAPKVNAWWARQQSPTRKFLRHSAMFLKIENYFEIPNPTTSVTANGKSFVAWLSGEDTTSIEVLANYDSAEWKWLRGIYDQLDDAVKADGATMGLVINPLPYQLDAEYPVSVAATFARYCAEREIPCFDLLPTMRERAAEQPFVSAAGAVIDLGRYDVPGHRIAGEALAAMVLKAGLIPGRRRE